MKIALIGTAQSGKTTAFLAIAGPQSPHLLADQKSHLAMIAYPDARLDELAASHHSKKITYIQLGLVDSPLLTAHPEEGLNFNQVQDADLFALVLRAYDAYEDPLKAFQEMENLFILKDLEVVDQAMKKIEGELKKGRKEREKELPLLTKCQGTLQKEKPLRSLSFTPEEIKGLGSYSFLSQKPLTVLINIAEENIGKPLEDLSRHLEERGAPYFSFSAKTEKELLELEEKERAEFSKDLGIQETAKTKFVRSAFQASGIISFFTLVGEEAKAWALEKGRNVLEAAGKIHSDIARGFIKAEVFSYHDFHTHGSVFSLKEKGFLRLEGKAYVVKDGDVLNIKFSV